METSFRDGEIKFGADKGRGGSETQQLKLPDYNNGEEVRGFFGSRMEEMVVMKGRMMKGEKLPSGDKARILRVMADLIDGVSQAPAEIKLFFEKEELKNEGIEPTSRKELLSALQADAVTILEGEERYFRLIELAKQQLQHLGWINPELAGRLRQENEELKEKLAQLRGETESLSLKKDQQERLATDKFKGLTDEQLNATPAQPLTLENMEELFQK